MKPDSSQHNPDPAYLRGLVGKAGLSQRKTAALIGIDERTFRRYLSSTETKSYHPAPYYIQFALECLADE